jgi:hypothetical protein
VKNKKNKKESKQKISPEGDLLKKNQYEKAPVHEPVLFSNTVFFLNPPSLTVKEKIFCVFRLFIASMGIVVATVFLVKPRPALATPLIPIAEISESGRSALNKARSASYGFFNKKEEKKNHLDLIPDNQEKKRGELQKKIDTEIRNSIKQSGWFFYARGGMEVNMPRYNNSFMENHFLENLFTSIESKFFASVYIENDKEVGWKNKNDFLFHPGLLPVHQGMNLFTGLGGSWTFLEKVNIPKEIENWQTKEIDLDMEKKINSFCKNIRERQKENNTIFVVGCRASQGARLIDVDQPIQISPSMRVSLEIRKNFKPKKIIFELVEAWNPISSNPPALYNKEGFEIFFGLKSDFELFSTKNEKNSDQPN